MYELITSTEQSLFCKATSSSPIQENSRIKWNTKIYCTF